jgi:hypothetical protein
MKNKSRFFHVFAVFILICVAAGLSSMSMDIAVAPAAEIQQNSLNCIPQSAPVEPNVSLNVLGINQHAAHPIEYLFRIMFILFFISPPIIALLLFLIWKEMRARNKME